MLLEIEQALQTLTLTRVLGKRALFQAQTIYLDLQVMILLADIAQVDVVRPEAASASPCSVGNSGRGSKRRDHPIAKQAYGLAVWGIGQRPPHLQSQAYKLREQDSQQHQTILVAGEKTFHGPDSERPE